MLLISCVSFMPSTLLPNLHEPLREREQTAAEQAKFWIGPERLCMVVGLVYSGEGESSLTNRVLQAKPLCYQCIGSGRWCIRNWSTHNGSSHVFNLFVWGHNASWGIRHASRAQFHGPHWLLWMYDSCEGLIAERQGKETRRKCSCHPYLAPCLPA